VIERALIFCEHEIEKTGVSVERAFTDVGAVRGVAGQLTQVFVNLFTNAAHAMRESGGLLTITTVMREGPLVGGDPQTPARGPDGQDGFVVITITDDGHGIEEQYRQRVFDPFFTTKADGSGTGLGLSIVRGIVQSHGGQISVHARVPRGTIFQVELPAAARPADD
jgi:two-component system, NtrC family, sensor kinase